MSDYNELIAKLRFYANTADDPIYGICINSPKVMLQAADAIEQLVKERDAAIDCIYAIEDALDRGNDNNWARERIDEWCGVREDNDGKID